MSHRLTADRFADFFTAVHGNAPFPWQERLAHRVVDFGWGNPEDPNNREGRSDWLALPTAFGKTAVIDISVFALACQACRCVEERTLPRRTYFVVDRRTVVDQAAHHAQKLAASLLQAIHAPCDDILAIVATRLHRLAGGGTAVPLQVVTLRGGRSPQEQRVARRQVRDLLQPMIIASTVDQVGSQLLFRGYGGSLKTAPIDAGLTGNDALIVLDEAHCSTPFWQTLESVRSYRDPRRWAWKADTFPPFNVVVMSATPPPKQDGESIPPFRIDGADKADERLRQRYFKSKPARLVVAAKIPRRWKTEHLTLSDDPLIAHATVEACQALKCGHQRIAIVVNRVATAKDIYRSLLTLRDSGGEGARLPFRPVLMVGRMRPIDRDAVFEGQEVYLAAAAPPPPVPIVLVATQCLEVGADFSFDTLITECASLDALQQRFGRLNRLGHLEPHEIDSAILIRKRPGRTLSTDPVYGEALERTWQWVEMHAVDGRIDMSSASIESAFPANDAARRELLRPLLADHEPAPILLPAHIDMLVQTAPTPAPDLDISVFLHGPNRQAEVHIVFRADLDEGADDAAWEHAVQTCQPCMLEAITTPINRLRKWMLSESPGVSASHSDELADINNLLEPKDRARVLSAQRVVVFRGRDRCSVTSSIGKVLPGDFVILPASDAAANWFGYIPRGMRTSTPADSHTFAETESPNRLDIGDEAAWQARGLPILRLHPKVIQSWASARLRELLVRLASSRRDCDERASEIAAALAEIEADVDVSEGIREVAKTLLRHQARLQEVPYSSVGTVLLTQGSGCFADREPSDNDQEWSSGVAVPLRDHLAGVGEAARAIAIQCLPAELVEPTVIAARWHDIGKLDPRFQRYLRGGDALVASACANNPLAKSGQIRVTPGADRSAWKASALCSGFRHEVVSVELLRAAEGWKDVATCADLPLHLIASHHGHARPFAPPVYDNPPEINLRRGGFGDIVLSAEDRQHHALASSNAHLGERFWRVIRRHGWWQVAYLEAICRLSDWQASQQEQRAKTTRTERETHLSSLKPPGRVERPSHSEIILSGLDGSNPLAFLAALGVLRTLSDAWPDQEVRMHWSEVAGSWCPVLRSRGDLSAQIVVDATAEQLAIGHDPSCRHAHLQIGKNLSVAPVQFRVHVQRAAEVADRDRRRADFLASFGSEVLKHDKMDRIACTDLCFLFGSGHQHYLDTMAKLIQNVRHDHLREALFGPWRYRDERLSMRWDPDDAREHAYQWTSPGNETTFTVWGANLLASEGTLFFPTVPATAGRSTTGFANVGRATVFTWPLWAASLSSDVVRSLIQLEEMRRRRLVMTTLNSRGILAVFRSEKIKIGDGANFKWSFGPARAM